MMNDATLDYFRSLADAMAGDTLRDWQYVGPYISQRYYGITEQKAKDLQARFGGDARQMTSTETR